MAGARAIAVEILNIERHSTVLHGRRVLPESLSGQVHITNLLVYGLSAMIIIN